MVEINNQRKAFLKCWRGGGTDNGRQKARNHSYDVIVGRAIYWLPITLANLSRWPKLKSTGAGRYHSFFPLVGCPQAAWPERLLSEKSGRCGIAADEERGALPMIDRGDIPSGNRPLQQYLGFTAGRWLWSDRGAGADSLIAKFKEAGRNGQKIDV